MITVHELNKTIADLRDNMSTLTLEIRGPQIEIENLINMIKDHLGDILPYQYTEDVEDVDGYAGHYRGVPIHVDNSLDKLEFVKE